ncbi:MAG TPA: hypothetical protein VK864_03330 [Longimicrobiales bacterium]|nr:hypothetical protein [Longimicrobiales bacterium]
MVKRLISFAFAAAVLYAAWNTGTVLFHHYQFSDGLEQLALFAGSSTEDQLKERVLQLADQYRIPVDSETLTVHTDSEVTQITAPYTAQIKLLPNYTHEWKFEPKANVVHVR